MFKKRKVYTSNVYFILQSAVGLGWEKTKNKQILQKKAKTKLSTPTTNVPLFAFLVTVMNQANNSFKTKLDSFILQTCAKL